MTKKMTLRAVALAALLATSSMASIATAAAIPVTLTNTVGDLWTAHLGDTPVVGAFTDVFTLTPGATPGSYAWGTLVNTAFWGAGNISFTSADLNGTSLLSFSGGPLAPVVVWNVLTLLPNYVTGPLTLTVSGVSSGGSYGGDINLHMAPIPEPETYAMMIAGLGILAMLARRRKPDA